jgi:hypothetical protein
MAVFRRAIKNAPALKVAVLTKMVRAVMGPRAARRKGTNILALNLEW